MKVIFTCGGTGGHIYPAVGVAKLLRQRHPDANILFVGAEGGMETRLVPKEGFEITAVKVYNLRHSVKPSALAHNVKSLVSLVGARRQARAILTGFKPDMVVGTGGYASYPVTIEAAKLGIPTAAHESNAVPGWTTRMLSGSVDEMMISYERSGEYYKKCKSVTLTGTPVRGEFIGRDKADCLRALGYDDGKPLVLSFWGSLGARDMNRMILGCFELEAADGYPFRHIHACGKTGYQWMPRELKLPVETLPGGIGVTSGSLELREFIYDMPLMMNAADIVLCRAGASTLAELCAAAAPSILIPSPNVTNNHQDANARVLEEAGASYRMPESECTGEILYRRIRQLLSERRRLSAMSENAANMAILDATERIYTAIMRHITTRKN